MYTLSVIAAWYFSNIGVILLNKYLLSVYGFRYPIFLTMMHMVRARVPVLPRPTSFFVSSRRVLPSLTILSPFSRAGHVRVPLHDGPRVRNRA